MTARQEALTAWGVAVAGFLGSEAVAVHWMVTDPSFTPGVSDWLIVLLLGGPALFGMIVIPLMVIGTLVAMARYPC